MNFFFFNSLSIFLLFSFLYHLTLPIHLILDWNPGVLLGWVFFLLILTLILILFLPLKRLKQLIYAGSWLVLIFLGAFQLIVYRNSSWKQPKDRDQSPFVCGSLAILCLLFLNNLDDDVLSVQRKLPRLRHLLP